MQPDVSPSRRKQPPSYHAVSPIDGLYYPVEYINYRWFWLKWDDSDNYFGYWVRQTGLMDQGYAELGWDGRTFDVSTLQAPMGPSFTEAQGQAESSSTQPVASSNKEEDKDDDDPIDRNPGQTAALAAYLEGNPVFKDVAEAVDAPEDCAHYLPTILPSAARMQPASLNPIRV